MAAEAQEEEAAAHLEAEVSAVIEGAGEDSEAVDSEEDMFPEVGKGGATQALAGRVGVFAGEVNGSKACISDYCLISEVGVDVCRACRSSCCYCKKMRTSCLSPSCERILGPLHLHATDGTSPTSADTTMVH